MGTACIQEMLQRHDEQKYWLTTALAYVVEAFIVSEISLKKV
jgi:hypothetical protein